MQSKSKTTQLILCALFASLSAILSQISIPIGPVPINFTHVSIFLAAGLLGKRYGTVSQLVFVLLGFAGAPVFSGFRGGLSILAGPTGGFIIGYILCTFVTALLIERFGSSVKSAFASMYAGWVVTYAAGLPWFMFVTGLGLKASLLACVAPFLFGDLLKTVLSTVLVNRLQPVLGRKKSVEQCDTSC